MAFTGTATVTPVSQNTTRITGVSLAGDATGEIVFSDRTVKPGGAVSIPGQNWEPYEYQDAVVGLQSMVEVLIVNTTDVTTPVPFSIVKTGTTHDDFLISIHNDTAATAGPEMEIYITKAR